MANGESKLKLIHLFCIIIVVVIGASLAIGALLNQQEVNTKEIESKVGNDIFIQHREHEIRQSERMNKNQAKMLDILIEIQKK